MSHPSLSALGLVSSKRQRCRTSGPPLSVLTTSSVSHPALPALGLVSTSARMCETPFSDGAVHMCGRARHCACTCKDPLREMLARFDCFRFTVFRSYAFVNHVQLFQHELSSCKYRAICLRLMTPGMFSSVCTVPKLSHSAKNQTAAP